MRKQSIISSRLVAILAALAVALVAVAVILSKCEGTAVVEEKSDHVEVTPATIASIKSIGQWEFLTIHDEEYVDTVREGFFSDDGLARIYYGTLRLGLDMSHLDDHAIRMEGDTVLVATLPPVGLLDRHFIDEARTRPFYEKGRWEADARNDIRQLRLYARYDGFYASILLLGSFACFLALSLTATGSWAWMGLTSLCPLIVLLTPIFIYRRLCKFRDEGLGGTISAKRALLYVLRTTTNAALFFSLLQYLYLALADNGLMAGVVERIVMADQQQTEMIVKSLGMTMDQYMEQLRAIPAFAMACNSFVTLAMGGMLLSAIMAPLAKRG